MKNRKIKELKSRMHRFDNDNEIKDAYEGHLRKGAYRIDDDTINHIKRKDSTIDYVQKTAKDSLFFGGLFRDLMSQKSHYITYLNDLFDGKKKSEMYIPKYVNCFVKKARDKCFNECVGSRLANLLGVETVYNIAIEADEQNEYNVCPEYDSVVSVDFTPFGYSEEALVDMVIFFDEDTTLENIFLALDCKKDYIVENYNLDKSEDKWNDFKRKIAKQFVFRTLVCEDLDFSSSNMACLIGENGDYRLAPCFDMELLFDGPKSVLYYKQFASETMRFLSTTIPDLMPEIMKDYKKAVESGALEKVVKGTLQFNPMVEDVVHKRLIENYGRLDKLFTQLMNNEEMLIG